MLLNFERTIAALADTMVRNREPGLDRAGRDTEAVAQFLIMVMARMPDYLRLPFRVLTLIFDGWPILLTGKPFHRLDLARRAAQVATWQGSRIEIRRRLMEFYGSLAIFCLYSELYGQDYQYE